MMIAFVLMLPFMYIRRAQAQNQMVFVGAVALLVAAEGFLACAHSIGFWLVGLLVFFTGFNLPEATLPSLVSKLAPAGNKGTAMGVYSTCQFLGAASGGIVGGFCYQHWGFDSVLMAALVVNLIWLGVASGMRAPVISPAYVFRSIASWSFARYKLVSQVWLKLCGLRSRRCFT
ncbi:MAG: hypothetical protein NVV73_03420 [Cellvibrionaceae bacterium]|nr:hypothetical protein [Cellvibrionaceae bacterium]